MKVRNKGALSKRILFIFVSGLLSITSSCRLLASQNEPPVSFEDDLICVSIMVPDGNWRLLPFTVYQSESNLWVFGSLKRIRGYGIQQIMTLKQCMKIQPSNTSTTANDKPIITIYINGKTWQWSNNPKFQFIKQWPKLPQNYKKTQVTPIYP